MIWIDNSFFSLDSGDSITIVNSDTVSHKFVSGIENSELQKSKNYDNFLFLMRFNELHVALGRIFPDFYFHHHFAGHTLLFILIGLLPIGKPSGKNMGYYPNGQIKYKCNYSDDNVALFDQIDSYTDHWVDDAEYSHNFAPFSNDEEFASFLFDCIEDYC